MSDTSIAKDTKQTWSIHPMQVAHFIATIIVLIVVLMFYAKARHIEAKVDLAVSKIEAVANPVTAIENHVTGWLQSGLNKILGREDDDE